MIIRYYTSANPICALCESGCCEDRDMKIKQQGNTRKRFFYCFNLECKQYGIRFAVNVEIAKGITI